MKTKVTLGMMMAIALASCTQEEALTFDYGEKTLHVSVESTEISSRVGFTDGEAKFFWTKNDAIGVTTTSAKKSFQKMTFQGNGGEATGDFKGSISGDPFGYAVYPSNSSHKMSGSTLTYNLPNTYSYTMLDDTYANATGNSHNMPMWAEIKDGAAAFKHLGGVAVVEINDLPENTSGLTFTFTASSKINGTFTVDLANTEPVLETSSDNVSDAEKEVTITFSTAENQTKGYFYVPVPIGTYDWNVKVTDGEGEEKAQGIWEEKKVERKDIYRLKIGESTIVGGEDNTKTVSSVSNITDQVLSTTEENLTVKVTGEVSGTENTITIPSTLQTEVTTFSFTSVGDGAAITITEETSGTYTGKIVIEIPEDETIPTVTATVPDGEVYIKQGTVTTLVTSSAENTTIIGAKAKIGTLTVNKGNVRLEDGATVNTINRGDTNSDAVTYIIYEGTIPNGVTSTDVIKHISAAEWDLMKDVANGGDVTLTQDVTLTEPLNVTADLVLNLNGKTITTELEVEGRHHYAIYNRATLTLKGEGAINARGVKNFSTMTVDGNITITNVDTNGGAAIWNEGALTVNSGTFTTAADAGTGSYGAALNTRANATTTVNGGKFIANSQLTYAIINNGGEVVINDAEVEGKHGAVATELANSTTNIYGGTFKQTDNAGISDHCIYTDNASTTTLFGGTYSIETLAEKNGGKVFCGDNIEVAEGYAAVKNADDTWTVKEGKAVSTVDELESALSNSNVKEIFLSNDIEFSSGLVFTTTAPHDVVIDGNGSTISFTAGTASTAGNDPRLIDVTKETEGMNLTLKNITIENKASWVQRVINYNTYGTLTLNNVTIKHADNCSANYAVNLPGVSDNCTVVINNCNIGATAQALNIWGTNSTITVTDSHLYIIDNSTEEGYSVIAVNDDGSGNSAEPSVVTVTGGSLKVTGTAASDSYAVRNNTTSSTITISETTEVVGDIVEEVAIVYYEGQNEFYSTSTLAGAITKAKETNAAGIRLIRDVTCGEALLIDSSLKIEGNGHTLTTSATRAIRLTASDIDVEISNLNIVSTAVASSSSDVRGIAIDANLSGVDLALNQCAVDFTDSSTCDWTYGVNVAGNTSGIKLTINGGTYEGANVVNIWGSQHTINIDGATLNSTYKPNVQYSGVCVKLSEGTSGHDVTIKNTTFNSPGGNAMATEDKGSSNTITQEGNTDNTKTATE